MNTYEYGTMGLEQLEEEKNRLNSLIEAALENFANYEEELNQRMKIATGADLQALMRERSEVEETLGLVDLFDRLDALRLCAADVKGRRNSAA